MPGITFIRLTRPATTIVYDNNEEFAIGKAKVVRKSDGDKVTTEIRTVVYAVKESQFIYMVRF